MRRVAAHWLYMAGRERIHLPVVEIEGDNVVNYYSIEDELPVTEWLGGSFILSSLGDVDLFGNHTLRNVINRLSGDDEPHYPLHCWYTPLLDIDDTFSDFTGLFSLLHEHN